MATSATSDTKNAPFRGACITINNPTPDDYDIDMDKVGYFAYSDEIGESGTPHIQGFAYSKKAMKLSGWKKIFPRAHIEKMRGSFSDNVKYCSKQSELIEFGTRPSQGERTDLLAVKALVKQGKRPMDIADDHDEHFVAVARHHVFFERYHHFTQGKRMKTDFDPVQVFIRWGEAGAGKSRYVYDTFPDVYTMPDNTAQWFGSYNGQSTVLFDDVEIGNIPSLSTFKRITDRYPIEVPVKGGFVWWKPKRIFFTANSHWTVWWKQLTEQDQEAIKRRLTSVLYLRKGSDPVEEYAN